jgi:hypothetical protein
MVSKRRLQGRAERRRRVVGRLAFGLVYRSLSKVAREGEQVARE